MNCDVCGSNDCELIDRSRPGHNHGTWPWAWMCNSCGASVGCHPDTDIPLGFMASGEVRKLRRVAHSCFDDIWRAGFMSRERAKEWMRESLNLKVEFHISQIKYTQLLKCIQLCEEYLLQKTKRITLKDAKMKHRKHITKSKDRIFKKIKLHKEYRKRR